MMTAFKATLRALGCITLAALATAGFAAADAASTPRPAADAVIAPLLGPPASLPGAVAERTVDAGIFERGAEETRNGTGGSAGRRGRLPRPASVRRTLPQPTAPEDAARGAVERGGGPAAPATGPPVLS